VLRARGGDLDWHLMADPEGNEFCAFVDESDRSSRDPSLG